LIVIGGGLAGLAAGVALAESAGAYACSNSVPSLRPRNVLRVADGEHGRYIAST